MTDARKHVRRNLTTGITITLILWKSLIYCNCTATAITQIRRRVTFRKSCFLCTFAAVTKPKQSRLSTTKNSRCLEFRARYTALRGCLVCTKCLFTSAGSCFYALPFSSSAHTFMTSCCVMFFLVVGKLAARQPTPFNDATGGVVHNGRQLRLSRQCP